MCLWSGQYLIMVVWCMVPPQKKLSLKYKLNETVFCKFCYAIRNDNQWLITVLRGMKKNILQIWFYRRAGNKIKVVKEALGEW